MASQLKEEVLLRLEVMASTVMWLTVAAALLALALGVGGVLKLLLCVVLSACGCLLVAFVISDAQTSPWDELRQCRQRWRKIRTPAEKPERPRPTPGSSLTGEPPIDAELSEILSFVLRDFVHVWQCKLTHTNDFSHAVQETVQTSIAALSDRVRMVDWIPFLTTRLASLFILYMSLFY